MAVANKTLGKVRYFSYFLHFPGDHDVWVQQSPFIHELQFQLAQTRWRNDPIACHNLIRKGEHSWKDKNGVLHRVVIEDTERPKRWGVKRA